MNQSPRRVAFSASILRVAFVFLLSAISIAAQSKIVRPTPQPTPKRTHVTTLRASESSEGSRVAISSDQSLNNYEAYRRGDRFYVKIPAADVPRAEAVRGRGFADVKAQRSGDSTILSFRLQLGATAHVEQRSNKLDVVVSVPGGTPSVASNRSGREVSRPATPETNRGANNSKRGATPSSSNKTVASNAASREGSKEKAKPGSKEAASLASNKNTGNQKSSPSSGSTNSNSGSTSNANSAAKATPSPTPAATPSPKPSPSVKGATPTPNQKSTLASSTSPSPVSVNSTNETGGDGWSQMKARARYWLLLAQLNPIPVIAGTLILLAIIALLLFQRRRARATKRVKVTSKDETSKASVAAPVESSVANESSLPDVAAAEAAIASTAAASSVESAEVAPEPVVAVPPSVPEDNGRRERVTQISSEAKKVFDGEQYDESLIGSGDPETRRLVGAELLSAMVGRNPERRDRAREAFMKHGYFDDATRDLRVAESENERAAAARRLSFVQDPEATPHLVGALQDSSPDVRRAAVEALMDSRDPAAIAPLNSLLQNETDRKVPRNLIQQAIDACATSSPATTEIPPSFTPGPSSQALETEREVIEL